MTKRERVSSEIKSKVLIRDGFSCKKCGSRLRSDDLEIHPIKMKVDSEGDTLSNLITLCSICHYFAPDEEKDFAAYLSERIDGATLDTFRKSNKSISRRIKKGMISKSEKGNIVSRAPYGYKIENKHLIPDEKTSYIVREIFEDFLNKKISLTKLSKKYGFSVNGLKKVLTNLSYLGKIKFDGAVHNAGHQPLISSTLFNHVQNKLEELGIKPLK